MKTISALLLSAVALSPLAAHAQNSNWYAVLSVGQSTFDVDRSDLDSAIHGIGLAIDSSSLDDTDTGYKIQAGYKFSENFALEGGYMDLGRASYSGDALPDTFLGVDSFHLGADVQAYGFNIDAVGILPLGAGFSVFGKAGLVITQTEISVAANGSGVGGSASEDDDDTETNVAPSLGVGLTFDLTETLSARLEYQRVFAMKTAADDFDDIDADLASIGLVARF
jgi:OOP family OmpA-OmpF porin